MAEDKVMPNFDIIAHPQHHHRASLQQIGDIHICGIHDRHSTSRGSYHSLYNHQVLNEAAANRAQQKRRCYSESDKTSHSVLIRQDYGNNFDTHGFDETTECPVASKKLSSIVAHSCYSRRHYIAVVLIAIVAATVCVAFFATKSKEPKEYPILENSHQINVDLPKAEPRVHVFVDAKVIPIAEDDVKHPHSAIVHSAADLLKIDKNCESVTVNLLKDDFDSPPRTLMSNVKILNIVGPVTEDWIQYLLRKFDRVENLTIDAYELCRAAKEKNKNSLNTLTLTSIKSLQVQNARLCSISSWIFKWNMPNIKHLKIHNSDLQKQVYEPIHKFLERNKNTLSTVIISHSFLCEECIYTDIKFKDMEQFLISEQVQEPWIIDD